MGIIENNRYQELAAYDFAHSILSLASVELTRLHLVFILPPGHRYTKAYNIFPSPCFPLTFSYVSWLFFSYIEFTTRSHSFTVYLRFYFC
jgi:hypothetical protein